MATYYNENDPYAAHWLRRLIFNRHIAEGDVDERSIADVHPDDLKNYTQCHFFAGIGGWSLALRMAGWDDDRPVWTGSCPCQPFSAAGKQKGFADERHLWPVWRPLIAKRLPPTIFGEQVASATQWLRLVRGDLEALGYAVGAMPVQAASAGADHLRDRFWFVADRRCGEQPQQCDTDAVSAERNGSQGSTSEVGRSSSDGGPDLADADDARLEGRGVLPERAAQRAAGADGVARDVGDAEGDGEWGERERRSSSRQERTSGGPSADCEWVIGADGKSRRVKSGVRLLDQWGCPGCFSRSWS